MKMKYVDAYPKDIYSLVHWFTDTNAHQNHLGPTLRVPDWVGLGWGDKNLHF